MGRMPGGRWGGICAPSIGGWLARWVNNIQIILLRDIADRCATHTTFKLGTILAVWAIDIWCLPQRGDARRCRRQWNISQFPTTHAEHPCLHDKCAEVEPTRHFAVCPPSSERSEHLAHSPKGTRALPRGVAQNREFVIPRKTSLRF